MGTLAKRAHSLKEYSCCETEVSHPTRLTIDLEGGFSTSSQLLGSDYFKICSITQVLVFRYLRRPSNIRVWRPKFLKRTNAS